LFFLSADGGVGVPVPPQAARELFGATLPQAQAYANLLAGPGVERGLIGPAEAERIWDRHLVNSALVAELLPGANAGASEAGAAAGGRPLRLADLGSGAGLPGIVLAIMRPDLSVMLVEPMARRTAFLAKCVTELGLGNVEVCRARAEKLAGKLDADVVTSRAVAPLDRLAMLAAGLCRPGGLVLAIKGVSADAELRRARPVLRELAVVDVDIVTAGAGLADLGGQPTTVIRFRTRELPE
jgi:16S rRNA (guanine527-N7)-methyltransferase